MPKGVQIERAVTEERPNKQRGKKDEYDLPHLNPINTVLNRLLHQSPQERPPYRFIVQDIIQYHEALLELAPNMRDAVVLFHRVGHRQGTSILEPLDETVPPSVGERIGRLVQGDELALLVVVTPNISVIILLGNTLGNWSGIAELDVYPRTVSPLSRGK